MHKQQAQDLLEAYALARKVKARISFDQQGCSYPKEIYNFFGLFEGSSWLNLHYDPARDMQRLRDPAFLLNASLEDICSVLTAAWRGERYFGGLWKDLFDEGHLERAMLRLAAIFGLNSHTT